MKFRYPFEAKKPRIASAKRTGVFASRKEAKYAQQLEWEKMDPKGNVLDYTRQFPIHLPGCRYVVDFMVLHRDGTVTFVEVKGFETEVWKLKYRALRELRPHLFARLKVV